MGGFLLFCKGQARELREADQAQGGGVDSRDSLTSRLPAKSSLLDSNVFISRLPAKVEESDSRRGFDKGKCCAKRGSDTQASSHDDGGYGCKRQIGKGGDHGKGGGKGGGKGKRSDQKGKHVY